MKIVINVFHSMTFFSKTSLVTFCDGRSMTILVTQRKCHHCNSLVVVPIVEGICLDNLLLDKSKKNKLCSSPIIGGTLPDRKLFSMLSTVRLTRFLISTGK